MNDLKLFVWEEVLSDWSGGVAFALAHDAEEAKELLIENGVTESHWNGILLDGVDPREHTSPFAHHIPGGS